MVELKPCPFCGGKAERTGLRHGACIYYVQCVDCGAEIHRTKNEVDKYPYNPDAVKEATIKAWNKRAENGQM